MKLKVAAALAAGLLSAAPAYSATVFLDFEGAESFSSVGDFYSGLGVSFGGDAIALVNDDLGPYHSNAPTPGTVMGVVGEGVGALNAADGLAFVSQASFHYSSAVETTVGIFSGLNGTGTLLGTFLLGANAQEGCTDSQFCNWDFVSVVFGGAARSIQFGSAAFVAAFDNVTVNTVPLPAAGWLLLSALGGLGILRRRRSA